MMQGRTIKDCQLSGDHVTLTVGGAMLTEQVNGMSGAGNRSVCW